MDENGPFRYRLNMVIFHSQRHSYVKLYQVNDPTLEVSPPEKHVPRPSKPPFKYRLRRACRQRGLSIKGPTWIRLKMLCSVVTNRDYWLYKYVTISNMPQKFHRSWRIEDNRLTYRMIYVVRLCAPCFWTMRICIETDGWITVVAQAVVRSWYSGCACLKHTGHQKSSKAHQNFPRTCWGLGVFCWHVWLILSTNFNWNGIWPPPGCSCLVPTGLQVGFGSSGSSEKP